MKKIVTLFIIILSINLFSQEVPYMTSRDHAVLISAEVNDGLQTSITLKWQKNPLAEGYIILRKSGSQFTELTPQPLDTSVFEYTDTNIEIGKEYEYSILAPSIGSINTKIDNKDTVVAVGFYAVGYVSAGIKINAPFRKGKILLIVEENIYSNLQQEVDRLKEDLHLEGWGVKMKTFPRTEQFDPKAVSNVKDYILEEYDNDPFNLTTVLLLGRIAVPYSGRIVPDGHGNHVGAWPADLYYGQMDENMWTDVTVNDESASRDQNKNIPGDGKFDISQLPSGRDVQLAVGRVDFYNMPDFISEETDEMTLYKNYLDKNHSFRNGMLDVENRGIVDDNFGARNYTEGFASGGWRNIAANAGKDNVKKGDFITTLSNESIMWAYGCGGGRYYSAGGIGKTEDIAASELKGIFTFLFGSYFGDWDSENNFLRSPLATMPSVLTCGWSGRPQWYMHHMALGYPIGHSVKLSQNNYTEYYPNLFQNGQQMTIITSGNRQVHTALMGDPTLSMYPAGEIAEPEEAYVIDYGENNFEIKWEAPETDDINYYNIYRANEEYGVYKKLNDMPVQGTEYFDAVKNEDGIVYYMIKSAKPKTVNTATIYHESRGIKTSILTDIPNENLIQNIELYPIPAVDNFTIKISNTEFNNIQACLYDIHGNKIKEIIDDKFNSGIFTINVKIDNNIKSGIYFLKTIVGNKSLVNKVIINK